MVSRATSSVVAACLALVLGLVLGSSTLGSTRGPLPAQAAAGVVTPDFQPADHITEMDFVPIASCRLVDTRVAGGKLATGGERGFKARGAASLASQGGSSTGCGVAATAAAVSVTVVAVDPAKGGYLRGWAHATTEPLSSFMNVTKHVTLAGFTNQDLAVPGLSSDFRIRNGAGAMHVVIDVSGYYIAPMAAYVVANGTLTRRSRATNAVRNSTGNYTVTFDRDVSKCWYTTTAFGAAGDVTAEPETGQPTQVSIHILDTTGLINREFFLTVTC